MLTVGTIMREPLGLALRFAAWYLEAGADQIVILFDDPQDAAIDVLSAHPKIRSVRCDAKFWETIGQTPETHFPRRQNEAITALYHEIETGWFFNVDADELVYFGAQSPMDVLAQVDTLIESVVVETAEVIDLHDGGNRFNFRLPMDWATSREVYGRRARLFRRRRGLVGHYAGKSFTRAGLPDIGLRQHWPQRGKERLVSKKLGAADGAYLLHYIQTDFDTWRDKVEWRLASSGFSPQIKRRAIDALAAADPDKSLHHLYQRLHRLEAAELDRLKRVGKHLELSIDFDELVKKHFPQVALSDGILSA